MSNITSGIVIAMLVLNLSNSVLAKTLPVASIETVILETNGAIYIRSKDSKLRRASSGQKLAPGDAIVSENGGSVRLQIPQGETSAREYLINGGKSFIGDPNTKRSHLLEFALRVRPK